MPAGLSFLLTTDPCVHDAATRLTVLNSGWDLQPQHFAVHAGWRRHPLSALSRMGAIRGRMKAAIHALKYDRLHPAAHELGRMLAEAIAQLAEGSARRHAGGPCTAAPLKICREGL